MTKKNNELVSEKEARTLTLNKQLGKEVLKELETTLGWFRDRKLNEEQVGAVTKALLIHKGKIFLVGKGRSGLMAQAFAMRLSQINHKTRYLGEPTVPPVGRDDLFIVVSGSGTNFIEETRIAKNDQGARIVAITSYPDSDLAKMADLILIVPGREKEEGEIPYHERKLKGLPALALGTAFEILTMLVFDSIIGVILEEKKMTEGDMKKKHAKPQI